MVAILTAWDSMVLQTLLEMRTPFGVQAFAIITEFGSAAFVIVATALLCLFLWHRGMHAYAYGLVCTVVGAIGTSVVVKALIERARPPVEWRAVIETGYSLPSNHATASAALYGFLAYIVWNTAPEKWRVPFVALCILAIALAGFSRMYLGVHYFSDVLIGYAIGIFFAWIGSRIVARFK